MSVQKKFKKKVRKENECLRSRAGRRKPRAAPAMGRAHLRTALPGPPRPSPALLEKHLCFQRPYQASSRVCAKSPGNPCDGQLAVPSLRTQRVNVQERAELGLAQSSGQTKTPAERARELSSAQTRRPDSACITPPNLPPAPSTRHDHEP